MDKISIQNFTLFFVSICCILSVCVCVGWGGGVDKSQRLSPVVAAHSILKGVWENI